MVLPRKYCKYSEMALLDKKCWESYGNQFEFVTQAGRFATRIIDAPAIRSRFPPLVALPFFLPVQTTRFGSRIEESSSFEKCAAEIEWIGCLR